MKAIGEIDFQNYLESVLDDKAYTDSRYFYTPSDGFVRPKLDSRVQRYQSPKAESNQALVKRKESFSILEGLRKYQNEHVLLIGKPGSGKSTALERLLLEEAEKAKKNLQVKVPVLVRLRQYETSVIDLVQNFLMEHGVFLALDQLEQLLIQGRFLLLFDGVNELPSQKARTNLENFRSKFRKTTPIILTTRHLILGGTAGVENELEMEPLTKEQMQEFVKSHLSDQYKQMLPQIDDRLHKFAETPLLLVMLCGVFKQNHSIPSNLGEAFREFANIHYTKIKADVPTYQNSQVVWSKILQNLAFEMMQGNSSKKEFSLRITRLKAIELIQKQFNKPYDQASLWLEDLLKYHLIQLYDGNQIEFRHQLIQEYYAAEACVNDHSQLIVHATDPLWREVFLFTNSLLQLHNNSTDADSFLLGMKRHVDASLRDDEKLQQMLVQIYEKSDSVKAPYKTAATRAFYLELSGNFLIGQIGWKDNVKDKYNDLLYSLTLDRDNFELSMKIDEALKRAFERECELDNLIEKFIEIEDFEQELYELEFDSFEYNKNLFSETIKALERESDILEEKYYSLDDVLAPELHYDLLMSEAIQMSLWQHTFSFSGTLIRPPSEAEYCQYPATPAIEYKSEMKQAMKQLLDQMENLIAKAGSFPEKHSEEYRSWWQSDGYEWLRQFLAIMQKYQDIGHNWELDDSQKQLLRSYYYANQLLVDCLNSNSRINAEVRQEIEDTLLLPIAETEKQTTRQSGLIPADNSQKLINQPLIYNDYRGANIGNLAHNVQGSQNNTQYTTPSS
jgi:predicted NACHT family NTPase